MLGRKDLQNNVATARSLFSIFNTSTNDTLTSLEQQIIAKFDDIKKSIGEISKSLLLYQTELSKCIDGLWEQMNNNAPKSVIETLQKDLNEEVARFSKNFLASTRNLMDEIAKLSTANLQGQKAKSLIELSLKFKDDFTAKVAKAGDFHALLALAQESLSKYVTSYDKLQTQSDEHAQQPKTLTSAC